MAKKNLQIKATGKITRISPVINRKENGPVYRVMLQLDTKSYEKLVAAAEAADIEWRENANGDEYLPIGVINLHRDKSARLSVFPVKDKDGNEKPNYIAMAEPGDKITINGIFAQEGDKVEFRSGKKEVSTTGYFITGMTGDYMERISAKLLADQKKKLIESILNGTTATPPNSDDE